MRVYDFVGPKRLLADVDAEIPRFRLARPSCAEDLFKALHLPVQREATLTFVVGVDLQLWVADRHSEHVACARGTSVVAAGEITIGWTDGALAVLSATNQSTGYCPDPDSWRWVAKALDAMGIDRPDGFEAEFHFGRCVDCRAIAVVKDGVLDCVECGGVLGDVRA